MPKPRWQYSWVSASLPIIKEHFLSFSTNQKVHSSTPLTLHEGSQSKNAMELLPDLFPDPMIKEKSDLATRDYYTCVHAVHCIQLTIYISYQD